MAPVVVIAFHEGQRTVVLTRTRLVEVIASSAVTGPVALTGVDAEFPAVVQRGEPVGICLNRYSARVHVAAHSS